MSVVAVVTAYPLLEHRSEVIAAFETAIARVHPTRIAAGPRSPTTTFTNSREFDVRATPFSSARSPALRPDGQRFPDALDDNRTRVLDHSRCYIADFEQALGQLKHAVELSKACS
jgi:hypothetical protein